MGLRGGRASRTLVEAKDRWICWETDNEGLDSASIGVPAGTRRVAAILRGQDDAGPVLAFGELMLPARP